MKRVSKEAQSDLMDIDESKSSIVDIPRSKDVFKIGYMKPYTTDRLSREFIKNEVSKELKDGIATADFMSTKMKAIHKFSSYIILNSFWKIIFFHPIMWRWLYYVKQYDYSQLLPIVAEGKKKMDSDSYYVSMVLAMTMMTTMKNLTKKEAEQYQAELTSAQDRPSEKNTLGL